MKVLKEYNEQVVLINGAGCEVGKETALLFARNGAAVILCDQESDVLSDIIQAIDADGGHSTVYFTDATDPLQVAEMATSIASQYGRVDVLINNLTNHVKKIENEYSFEYYSQFFDNLVQSVSTVTSAVLPLMRQQQYGRVIHVLPGVIHVGVNGFPAFAAAQSTIHKMTREVASNEAEAGHDILVNILNPGVLRTELNPFYGEEPASIMPVLQTLATLPSEGSTGRLFTANIMDHQGQIYDDNRFDDEEIEYMDR